MGNCFVTFTATSFFAKEVKWKRKEKQNPFLEPTNMDILTYYEMSRELGHGEFGVTYFCTNINISEKFSCKFISKKKLRTIMDIEG
uniref:Protein kinase domain-containing protein n=1 Tax=Populus trichocarpa TaxID=3694 RepID=B9I730_POPTR